MINLGLSAADQAAFEATLRQSHRIRTTVDVLDSNEQLVYTFDGTVVSGAVQVDWSQAGGRPNVSNDPYVAPSGPVRTLDLTVMRPDKEPTFLPNTPGSDVVWAGNFVSVLYGVWVDGLTAGPDWVDVPVFWGPITEIDQDGAQFDIKASGKEVLALDPCLLWDTVTIAKGTQRTDAIKALLSPNGEARYNFATINSRTSALNSYNRYTQPWAQAQAIAHGGNLQLFYDGLGRARLRPWSTNRLWLFDDGDSGCVLSRPQITYNISQARNVVEVIGGTPSGSKTAIRAVSYADPSNPLSGESLARNGERRWMIHTEQSAVTSQSDAQQLADSLLFQLLEAAVSAQFDSLTIPHLEEGDTVAVSVGGQQIQFALTQFTLPLVSTANMTVGSNQRVAWNRRGKGAPVYLLGA